VISTINDDPHIDICLTQGANQSTATPVSRIKNTEGKRTLGVCLAPDGSDKTEHAFHLKDATKLCSCLLNAPLNKESTQIRFMGSMILQKFGYPLGATCFKQEECLEIQQKFPPTILSKMGINESTPTNICSGPAMFAGMKVPELWTIQGSTKNKLMIDHLCKTDVIGDTIVVSLDCLQLQAGTSWQVLSHEGSLVRTYVNRCWASHLWEFNNRYNLTIYCEDKPWLLPQQEHDQFIMEALTGLPEATKK
jgi:hypothetical protein